MIENAINIEAYDCLPFKNEKATADILQKFMDTQIENIFWFSSDKQIDTDSKLAEYDYRKHQWLAGRFVGEAIFEHQEKEYKITIKPRFGESFLFKMLEEIFNIRITNSASSQKYSHEWQHYIKRIIAFIWIQKLANANLHGLPKKYVKQTHKGQLIKGRMNVRKSILPYYRSEELVSNYYEKQIDSNIAQIIQQAYQILKADFHIGKINIPDSAQEALNQVQANTNIKEYISKNQYRNIKYKDIYMSWKPLVELSWDIIQRKNLSLKQNKAQNGFGFFIDMAEVWEQYLRVILKKNLRKQGWKYRNDKEVAYSGYFFKRQLIPDLVFQKENTISVWDAKYKRMLGRPIDIDRTDFFQIHTYIQNYINKYNVKAGGLLFPISTQQVNFDNYRTQSLLNNEGIEFKFCIDGIELEEESDGNDNDNKQQEFIGRIIEHLG
jgi:5-methylcytosine-specific restriction enzyme subunit McrC